MTIRVVKYKKPTLILTLAVGGSLVANTTYYFTGVFVGGYGAMRDGGHMGPAADQVNITTNDTHKTVNVEWRTVGDITAFADNGDGTINVSAYDHCLDTGDTVTIQNTTNYNGSYVITWVDYDTYKITKAYVASETGDWYDNHATNEPNDALGIQLYVDDADLKPGGVWVKDKAYWSHAYHRNGYTSNNIVYDSLLTNTGSRRYHPELSTQLDDYIPSSFSKTMGKIDIYTYAGSDYTLDDIGTALSDAHCEDISTVGKHSLTVLGGLRNMNSAVLDLDFSTINLIGGQFVDAYYTFSIEDSHIYAGPLRRGMIAGDFVRCAITGRMETRTDWAKFTNSFLDSNVLINYLSTIAGSKANLTITTHIGYRVWTAYPVKGSYWKNIEHVKGYLFAMSGVDWGETDDYPNNIFEDLTFTDIDGAFDIYVYVYPTGPRQVSFYNTVSNRAGGISLRIGNLNTTDPVTVPFWFKIKTKIVDEDGNAISNAEVTVTDNNDVVYNWTTDVNGEIDEWVKAFDFVTPNSESNDVKTVPDNLYYPFNISIIKTGYETYTTILPTLTTSKDWLVTLKTSPAFTLSTDGNLSKYLDPDNPKNLGLVLPL